ncbi:FUSC family protein [Loktanella sp. DSM 29012]|uniref:FUSC family protein n=1 Tax=Loktanella sp. DSM 29012 TaxID=1881056 RepID=UPI000B800A45|nr:FUSC family protein [Loktanella sp. DSM 29012]
MNWFVEDGEAMPWRSVAVTTAAVAGPALVAVPLIGSPGAIAFIAGLSAHLAARDRGIGPAALVTLVLMMSGLLVLGAPVMALILAPCLAVMIGICGTHGMAQPGMRALIVWTIFTSPILPDDRDAVLAAIFIGGMIWALAITWWFDEDATGDAETAQSHRYALIFEMGLGIGLMLSVYVGGRYFGEHGFWFPLTFVVLCVPPHGNLFSKTLRRTIGTVLGTAIAIAVAAISEEMWLTVAVGMIALPIAFRFLPRNYTLFTTFLTVAVLEILALVSQVSVLAVERLVTMAAAAAMTVVMGVLGIIVLRLVKPDALRALQSGE